MAEIEPRVTHRESYRYRAWDGTQHIEALAPETLLAALTDALLTGDIERTLTDALHRGVKSEHDADSLPGLDTLREQVRRTRQNLEQELTQQALPNLAETLRNAGGDASTDDLHDMLAALSAHPDITARLLLQTNEETRATLESALTGTRRTPQSPQNGNFSTNGLIFRQQIENLNEIEQLEGQVRTIRRVGDLGSVDPELIRRLLGDDPVARFSHMSESLQAFIASGYLHGRPGHLLLSARALQQIGDALLRATLERIARRTDGPRLQEDRDGTRDLTGATRPWAFGDPLSLDLSRTVLHAVRRAAGTPVRISTDDFAVFEREDTTRAATILAIDLSRSMGERGYLLAAKKLALALATLIRQRYPRDLLQICGFSETARALTLDSLPGLTWDRFGFGTNIQDALRWSRIALAPHRGMQRNILLLTDGEPTAYRNHSGHVHFHHPPTNDMLAETFAEGHRVRRDGIDLTVCTLSQHLEVVKFAEELARCATGTLVITSPEDLAATLTMQFTARRR